LEGSISVWATSHVSADVKATRALYGFWGAFLVSRLVVAALLYAGTIRPDWETGVLVVCALLAAVVLGNMSGSASPGDAGRGLLLLGFCLGPILPTLVGMLFKQLETSKAYGYGTAFGVLFAAGSLGSLLLVPVVARVGRKDSPLSALRVPMGGALLLSAAA